MHKRTKACSISRKTKKIVYDRDKGSCIFCGRPGNPEAHVIARSHGGLGIPENIVTVCRECHDRMDNSTDRKAMIETAENYLREKHPGWKREDCIYRRTI